MAPACCIISVESEPKPSPSPPNCETTLTKGIETISSHSVTVRFSHTTYTFLYHEFVWEKKSENIICSRSLDALSVSINFGITWRVEKNEFTFHNQQDAESWKKLVPFCGVLGPPERLKAFDEIKPEKFKELLNISEEDWDNAWNSSSYTKLGVFTSSASNCYDSLSKEIWKEKKVAEKKVIKEEKERKKAEKKEEKERKKAEKREKKDREKAEKKEKKKEK